MSAQRPETGDDRQRIRINIRVALFALLVVGLLYLVVESIKGSVAPQDCHMAGFTSCQGGGALITPPHRRNRLE